MGNLKISTIFSFPVILSSFDDVHIEVYKMMLNMK